MGLSVRLWWAKTFGSVVELVVIVCWLLLYLVLLEGTWLVGLMVSRTLALLNNLWMVFMIRVCVRLGLVDTGVVLMLWI